MNKNDGVFVKCIIDNSNKSVNYQNGNVYVVSVQFGPI